MPLYQCTNSMYQVKVSFVENNNLWAQSPITINRRQIYDTINMQYHQNDLSARVWNGIFDGVMT